MAAVVLAFQAPKPQPQRPWQNHELAELYRAVNILGRAGLAITTDMGVSDEGDPWFAFCRADTGDVIVHCARISGVFVASSIAVSQTFRGGNFREVIDSIVRYQPLGIPVTTTNSQLFLHPLMVLAAFVATALLCSKNADAHDLHAAIVSLTPAEPATGHKGLAALKAAVSDILGLGSHVDADVSKLSDLTATNAETIPLAAFMAAALSIIKPSFDAFAQTMTLSDSAILALPDQSHAAPQPGAPSGLLLNTNQEIAIIQADAPLASAAASTTSVAAIDWTKFGDLKLTFQITSDTGHAAPVSSPDTVTPIPVGVSASAESALLVAQFDHFVLHHAQSAGAVITTAAIPPIAASATLDQSVAATPPPDFIQQAAADFGIVTSVALKVFLGSADAQPQAKDALALIAHLQTDPALPLPTPVVAALTNQNSGSDAAQAAAPQAAAPQAATPQAATPQDGMDLNVIVAQAVAAMGGPPAAAPTLIVLADDPVAGLAQLANYAMTAHTITSPITPAQDLQTGVSTYTSQIEHSATLVVFDSNSVKLPFFEFIKGVIFVDDHELGITPTDAMLAGAVTVDLAAGSGTMKLLGVIDSSHLAPIGT